MMGLLSLFAASCGQYTILSFPTWYVYLQRDPTTCNPKITSLTDIWLIVAAIIEILLRIAALAAVVFVIYGGILYTTSQGSPEQTGQAKNTIVNALIGLAIAVIAAATVAFIAGRFN